MKQNFQRNETEVSQFAPTLPETPSTLNSSVKPSALESQRVRYQQQIFSRCQMYPKAQVPRPKNPFIFLCFFMLIFTKAS